ncbi:MAG: thioredoxin [Clostridia bacterium]|nr:thioredoxin [Clostridia bacterium]
MKTVLTKDNFDSFVKSDKTVIVDFYADWCGPCKMLAPILEEISQEYSDKALVGVINVDEQMELAMRFGIQSIPTLLIYKNGELDTKQVGYCTKDKLISLL